MQYVGQISSFVSARLSLSLFLIHLISSSLSFSSYSNFIIPLSPALILTPTFLLFTFHLISVSPCSTMHISFFYLCFSSLLISVHLSLYLCHPSSPNLMSTSPSSSLLPLPNFFILHYISPPSAVSLLFPWPHVV